MDSNSEIKHIIENILKKKKFEDVDKNKVLYLLENAELNVDMKKIDSTINLDDLKSAAQRKQGAPRLTLEIYHYLKRIRFALIPAVAAAAIFVFYFLQVMGPASRYSNGVIKALNGSITVVRGSETKKLTTGDIITQGDIVITEKNSRADIDFSNEIFLRVFDESTVQMKMVNLQKDSKTFKAFITLGRLLIQVNPLSEDDMVSVTAPNSAASVKGTLFGVAVQNDSSVSYEVYEGKIRVKRTLENYDLKIKAEDKKLVKEFFDNNAWDVAENSMCTVRGAEKMYSSIIRSNVQDKIKRIPVPVIQTIDTANSLLSKEVDSFVRQSSAVDSSYTLFPVSLSLKPALTEVYVDGTKRSPANDKLLVSKGTHDFRFQSPGYISVERRVPIDENRDISVVLNKEPAEISAKAHYILYYNTMHYIIRISKDGFIDAYKDRKKIWSINLEGPVLFHPVMKDNFLIVHRSPGLLSAIDMKKGIVQWKHETGFTPAKIIAGEKGIFLVSNGGVINRMAYDGTSSWNYKSGSVITAVSVKNGNVLFAAAQSGDLLGLDAGNGKKIFSVTFKNSIISLNEINDRVYLLTGRGIVYCYNYEQDKIIWDYDTGKKISAKMVTDKRSIYLFAVNGFVIRLALDGNLIWIHDIRSKIVQNPVTDGNNFYYWSGPNLIVQDMESGTVKKSIKIPGVITGNMAISGDKIYFETPGGKMTSINK